MAFFCFVFCFSPAFPIPPDLLVNLTEMLWPEQKAQEFYTVDLMWCVQLYQLDNKYPPSCDFERTVCVWGLIISGSYL